ncbi:MAG: NAD(P)-dependent oxidoreductase [Verrucomicrobia bacterium]|nr:NAD(P)-dependent oxidoreductase [Verrucomicrobiota bacterium]
MKQDKEIILITGCSGRIGFKCAEEFSDKYRVLGADVFLVGHLPGIELIGIDLGSPKNLQEGLATIKAHFGNRIASVIHLAAYYSFTKGHWAEYERITVNGTKNLLEGLLKDFEVGQFIFSSTMLVHAPCKKGEKITEESPVVPTWNYPKSKVLTENLIHEKLHGKIPYVILRIAGVYDDLCHSIPLSNQIQRIYENQFEGHVFAGDTSHGAAFIHMDDLVDAITKAVEKRKELPKELVLLLGEPTTLSYDQLQRQISKLIYGKEWKTWGIPKPIAKLGAYGMQILPFFQKGFIQPWMIDLADDHYELDISKAKRYLNWEPRHQLKETIPLWIDQLKREPHAWYDINKLKPSKVIKGEN